MEEQRRLSAYSKSFWLILAALGLFLLTLLSYLYQEHRVRAVAQGRFVSYELTEELRESSDDLTRMARSYILTGDKEYRRQYQLILDIREGKRSHTDRKDHVYWDLIFSDSEGQPFTHNRTVSLMNMMREAGFSQQEFSLLTAAKNRSDALTSMEVQAMNLYESVSDEHALNREKAINVLFGAGYMREKAEIVRLIEESRKMLAVRAGEVQEYVQRLCDILRIAMMLEILLLLIFLWRAHRMLERNLGGTLEEIYQYIEDFGKGDFSRAIDIGDQKQPNIRSWIARSQRKLARMLQENEEIRSRNLRLTRLYNALSQCNQAIVRSHSEAELFERICHDSVVYGGMKMAWIGMIDADSQQLMAVAHYGDGAAYFDGLAVSRVPDAKGNLGPITTALQNEKPVWCQDFFNDSFDFHWHERGIPYGWRSRAILPLHKNGKVVGAFNLFLAEVNAFDEDSQRLLTEMALDISHALDRFELETARRHSLQMEALRSFMLERISTASSLKDILNDVVLKLETIIPDSMCSVMLLDHEGKRLRNGATPSLPRFYTDAIEGLEVVPGLGSCGNAIATGRRTIVEDINTHPFWAPYTALTSQAGLRACWSEPIFSARHQVLGAFAIYHKEPTVPQEFQLRLLEMTAHFIAIAIERKQTEDTLSKLSQAVDQSAGAVIITDRRARIEYANQNFLLSTGKTLKEVIGMRPTVFYPGKASFATYRDMITHVRRGDSWHGEWISAGKDGREHTDLLHISPVRNEAGEIINYLIIQEDITEKKRSEERIQFLAHYDGLTGLPNRRLLEERARYAIGRAARSGETLAVVFFDLDHFKDINDSLGHSFGDELLVQLARRLKACLRAEDTISRLGGDEFVLLLPGVDSDGAGQVVEKLMQVVAASYRINEHDLTVTTSMGIAMYPDDGKTLEVLSKNADAAMYRAKREGRNAYRFFTNEMQTRSARHLELLNALRYAIEHEQFSLHYQPQITIRSGRVVGVEALLRWKHHELGHISPAEFIPIAEDSGLILLLGNWVLETAVRQLKAWRDEGMLDLCMAVNLSAVQFRHGDLPHLVQQLLFRYGVPPSCLELELTESVAMHDPEGAISIMNQLHDLGVRMSIDDFGTGYSSLSYMKKFRIYKLKIDRGFVRDIHTDPEDKAIVTAVIGLAKSLGLKTIAEGVETREQLEFLRAQGCQEVQGFYYAKPMPADEALSMIRMQNQLADSSSLAV